MMLQRNDSKNYFEVESIDYITRTFRKITTSTEHIKPTQKLQKDTAAMGLDNNS